MGKKDKVMMPTGMAGLTRYGEELKNEIKIKPKHFIYFITAVAIAEFILRFV